MPLVCWSPSTCHVTCYMLHVTCPVLLQTYCLVCKSLIINEIYKYMLSDLYVKVFSRTLLGKLWPVGVQDNHIISGTTHRQQPGEPLCQGEDRQGGELWFISLFTMLGPHKDHIEIPSLQTMQFCGVSFAIDVEVFILEMFLVFIYFQVHSIENICFCISSLQSSINFLME